MRPIGPILSKIFSFSLGQPAIERRIVLGGKKDLGYGYRTHHRRRIDLQCGPGNRGGRQKAGVRPEGLPGRHRPAGPHRGAPEDLCQRAELPGAGGLLAATDARRPRHRRRPGNHHRPVQAPREDRRRRHGGRLHGRAAAPDPPPRSPSRSSSWAWTPRT